MRKPPVPPPSGMSPARFTNTTGETGAHWIALVLLRPRNVAFTTSVALTPTEVRNTPSALIDAPVPVTDHCGLQVAEPVLNVAMALNARLVPAATFAGATM